MRNPSSSDIAVLQARWQAAAKRKPRQKVEASIQDTCCKFLELDGWRRIKTDLGHLRGMGVQEKGIADDCFIRYGALPRILKLLMVLVPRPVQEIFERLFCEVLWCEWKAPKTGKTSDTQHAWHALERARGALTWKAGKDFDPTPEGFAVHYNASGLALVQRTIGAVRR